MADKKEMDEFQENSITNNNAGRSADRELGDKGGTNENAKRNQRPLPSQPSESQKSSRFS